MPGIGPPRATTGQNRALTAPNWRPRSGRSRLEEIYYFSSHWFPLRLLLTDPSERFQLRFAEEGAALLAGVSSVQTESSARGLTINALAERDIFAAVAVLQVAIPTAAVGAVEVIYVDQGTMEPYVRVRVTTPADHYGDVFAQLVQRRGLIEGLDDTGEEGKIVTATVPLAEMIGYDKVVAATTRGRGIVEYEFLDYRAIPSPPVPPKTPAARAWQLRCRQQSDVERFVSFHRGISVVELIIRTQRHEI
jgi:hypothetical protein